MGIGNTPIFRALVTSTPAAVLPMKTTTTSDGTGLIQAPSSLPSIHPPLLLRIRRAQSHAGASIQAQWRRWKERRLSRWNISIARSGLSLPLTSSRLPSCPPLPGRFFTQQQQLLIDNEVKDLLEEKAIVPVPHPHRGKGFYSPIFTVPKKDGEQRPVLDCRRLNEHLRKRSFRMESLSTAVQLLQPEDWMIKVDLRKAYLTIPIARKHQRLLRFRWRDCDYQFRAMPFGLSCAPLVFTKMMRPVVAQWRSKGIRCVIYLDDLLLMAVSPRQAIQHAQIVLQDLMDLGLSPSLKKSVLRPSQEMEFLGATINTHLRRLSLPKRRVDSVRTAIRKLLKTKSCSLRQLSSVIGLLQSTMPMVPDARLHTRHLLRLRRSAWFSNSNWESKVTLLPSQTQELEWWISALSINNHLLQGPLFPVSPILSMETDASISGWGAVITQMHRSLRQRFTRNTTRGFFSWNVRNMSNNARELLAAIFAMKSFLSRLPSARRGEEQYVLIKTDNMVTASYINKRGGRTDYLSRMMEDTLMEVERRNIRVMAQYLPGKLNTVADSLSRVRYDKNDWMLRPAIFSQLKAIYGPLDMDLFATMLNAQLPLFASWTPQPGSLWTDALMHKWIPQAVFYANPPFALILKVLRKIQSDRATVLLILPVWTTAIWWPLLLRMTLHRTLLPVVKDLFLPGHRSNSIPMNAPPWPCMACLVSGNPFWRKGFTMTSWRSWNSQWRHQLAKDILLHGTYGNHIAPKSNFRL